MTHTEQWSTCTVRATGERIVYLYRNAWDHRYYSFDHGKTWHRSKAKAFHATIGESQCNCCGAQSETVKIVWSQDIATAACDVCRTHCAPAYHPPCHPRRTTPQPAALLPLGDPHETT